MVMVMACERDSAREDFVHQKTKVVPKCCFAHVKALHIYRGIGKVDEPLRKAQKEVGINIIIDW